VILLIKINRYKHIKRYRGIIFIFVKYGFGTLIDQLGILKHLNIKRKVIDNEEDELIKRSRGGTIKAGIRETGANIYKAGTDNKYKTRFTTPEHYK